jgi:hypothetical protein
VRLDVREPHAFRGCDAGYRCNLVKDQVLNL